jgi:hypothetical protein
VAYLRGFNMRGLTGSSKENIYARPQSIAPTAWMFAEILPLDAPVYVTIAPNKC